jgi:hypothetical protein
VNLQIAHVVVWSNGMVSVFERDGEQMPEYQGRLIDVQAALVRDAPPTAHFDGGLWRERVYWPLSRAEFQALRPSPDAKPVNLDAVREGPN